MREIPSDYFNEHNGKERERGTQEREREREGRKG